MLSTNTIIFINYYYFDVFSKETRTNHGLMVDDDDDDDNHDNDNDCGDDGDVPTCVVKKKYHRKSATKVNVKSKSICKPKFPKIN